MLTGLAWLALEAKYLEPARAFYEETLEMDVERADATEVSLSAGETNLVLRRPASVPRGGLHTHFACSIPADEYDEWWDRLAAEHDLEETQFGSSKSLYLYDPDGNCVELGQGAVAGPGIDGVFEVALEVASLEHAESFYAALGFQTVDRGEDRRRVRMNGPMALELWEPQLGIADARGGVHVDLGFETADPNAAADAVADIACDLERDGDGGNGKESASDRDGGDDGAGDESAGRAIVRDPDGHHLTFLERE